MCVKHYGRSRQGCNSAITCFSTIEIAMESDHITYILFIISCHHNQTRIKKLGMGWVDFPLLGFAGFWIWKKSYNFWAKYKVGIIRIFIGYDPSNNFPNWQRKTFCQQIKFYVQADKIEKVLFAEENQMAIYVLSRFTQQSEFRL